MDIFVVRKLGVPGREELAMGAIAPGGLRVLNHDVLSYLHVPERLIDEVAARETVELERRQRLYRGERGEPEVRGRTVILVDDGLATGSSMRAAIAALRQKQPAAIVAAVPVAAPETCAELRGEVDDIVCAVTPPVFSAVSLWYEDFSQTTDAEVRELFERAASRRLPVAEH